VVSEPAWDSPQTEQLAQQACFDCHSNETVWPWYSSVAPMSWMLQRHVDEGRAELNFSEWGMGREEEEGEEAEELVESVIEGEMPPANYLPLHPEARLSAAEKETLAQGLAATAGVLWQPGMKLEDEDHDD
jgi:cytochrome c551/c552